MKRIFVVDDDVDTCVMLERIFKRAGYAVRHGLDSEALYRMLPDWNPHLIILDVRLDDEDGRDIAWNLRALYRTPILMLTGQSKVEDKVSGFESGADDYLCKPFNVNEMLARVNALLRRAKLREPSRQEPDGPLWVDQANLRLVAQNGASVTLTRTQADIARILLERAGYVISREALHALVYHRPWLPGTRSLDVYVSALRRDIRKICPERVVIQSVRNVGYRLVLKDAE